MRRAVGLSRRRLVKKKLRNDPDTILSFMAPHKPSLVGVVVESTYNWYWLVDLLMDEGYPVRLANPSSPTRGSNTPMTPMTPFGLQICYDLASYPRATFIPSRLDHCVTF
jgi:hypothetical protein